MKTLKTGPMPSTRWSKKFHSRRFRKIAIENSPRLLGWNVGLRSESPCSSWVENNIRRKVSQQAQGERASNPVEAKEAAASSKTNFFRQFLRMRGFLLVMSCLVGRRISSSSFPLLLSIGAVTSVPLMKDFAYLPSRV